MTLIDRYQICTYMIGGIKLEELIEKAKKGNIEAFTQLIMNLENDLNFYSLLKQLKYEERIVIILYYMEQYSVKDIKDILHMNENTIRANLSTNNSNHR